MSGIPFGQDFISPQLNRGNGLFNNVVHAGHFDPIRGRYVGAFSWTEFDELEPPRGYEWRRAMAVASTVYDNNLEAPLVNGALFYHATRVKPDWRTTTAQFWRLM